MKKTKHWIPFWVRALPTLCALICMVTGPAAAAGVESRPAPHMEASLDNTDSCAAAVALLETQNNTLTRDLRQIKRDIAALNQKLEEPGLKEAVAGIGYILGLFGVAAFMASRKNRHRQGD